MFATADRLSKLRDTRTRNAHLIQSMFTAGFGTGSVGILIQVVCGRFSTRMREVTDRLLGQRHGVRTVDCACTALHSTCTMMLTQTGSGLAGVLRTSRTPD